MALDSFSEIVFLQCKLFTVCLLGPELTEIMMHNLSKKITSEAELRNLATLGLRVKSDITDTNLTNIRDINNAALRVIEEWAVNKQDKKAAYVELCEILKKIKR